MAVGHGGARDNSGRKQKNDTKVMRVPDKYVEQIKELIRHLDETKHIDSNYSACESEPVFLRSLNEKRQNITFKTSPVTSEMDKE